MIDCETQALLAQTARFFVAVQLSGALAPRSRKGQALTQTISNVTRAHSHRLPYRLMGLA